jgi:hypothetical protein
VRGLGVASLVLAVALSACSDQSGEAAPTPRQTDALCDALKTFRQEAIADLFDGDTKDPDEFNASVGDFYLSLREFVPSTIRRDLEVVASAARDGLQEPTDDEMEAGVRTGTYFREQCGDELPIN